MANSLPLLAVSKPRPTDPVEPTPSLSAAQQTAIEWLTAGETAQTAASAAGVNRTTVYRWMKSDPAFLAAYNAWQADVLATARARLAAATDVAVTAVVAAMTRGDARTAMAVLGKLGLLTPPKPGPVDPAAVEREQAVAARRASNKLIVDEVDSYALGTFPEE